MTEPWTEKTLYELAAYINGRVTKPSERVPVGVPVIKIAELTRGITVATDQIEVDRIADKHWVRDGDLLFAWSGTVGIHIYRGRDAALNQHIFRVEAGSDVDQVFLRYLLEGQLRLFERIASDKQTTMGHVTVADLKRTFVAIPELDEQRRIARVLVALDAKIESNRRLAAAAWNVVRAEFARDVRRTHDHPSRPLSSIATFTNGGAYTRFANGTGMPIIRIRELGHGISADTPRGTIDAPGSRVVNAGDLLFSWSGTLLVVRWDLGEAYVNQHLFKVESDEFPLWFIECWVTRHLEWFRSLAADKATTMGHIQRRHLDEAQVVTDLPCLTELGDHMTALDRLRCGLMTEARAVKAVRDAILPRLVDGRVRVPESLSAEGLEQDVAALAAAQADLPSPEQALA